MPHPCLSCGACCATFRVAFHWSDAQPGNPEGPPAELVLPLRRHEVLMRGTESSPTRCAALAGTVGDDGHCSIYAQRPPPCRALVPAWEDGQASPQCDKARLAHGLLPLTPAIWLIPGDPGLGELPLAS
ncbi:YkgJ family cysteine cluster protein [Arenimonas alkanexedens]